MYQFFTEDYAGFPAQTLNWIALGTSILIALLILLLIVKLLRGSRLANGRRGRHARLAVTDAASIGDDRRKLVLVRRDNVEHLLLIGGSNDLVVESDIVRTAPQQTGARTPLATPVATTPAPVAAPAPVSNVAQPAAAPVTPAPVQPIVAPAAAVPAPQTPAPAPAAAPITPAPAQATTPSAAPVLTSAPAPATSTAPVAVAAATATAAAIASSTPAETTTKPEEETIGDTELDTTEIWDNSSVESAPETTSEINISKPVAEPVVTAAAQREPVSPMNSVEEMDALLNEITTEK